jgi:hypothetical protein
MRNLVTISIFMMMPFLFINCNSDQRITKLLKSNNINDIIKGARKAEKSGKVKFIPYLLNDAGDPRRSTSLQFKGVSVYQAKMEALENIFKKSPPQKIDRKVDSTIIEFYRKLAYEKGFLKD